jgi:glycolate oxidase iron-sulfur subunit
MPLPVLPPDTYKKFAACIHCGLCLPACPTYVETLDEADSPRGRIHLMKGAVDGSVNVSQQVFEHLDRCLVCRACETACPSGVEYHALIEAVRPQVAQAVLGGERRMKSGMLQWVVGNVLPHPKRVAAALAPLRIAGKIGLGAMVEKWMPGAMQMSGQVTHALELPSFTPAVEKHRGSVILLRGCVGSVASGAVNAACVKVLSRNGFDVHLLPNEPCCGALAAHANDPAAARGLAATFVESLEDRDADFLISPIAGCGAQLKSLGQVLASSVEYADRAAAIAGRVRDVSEFLMQQEPLPPKKTIERVVTYHDPCHLAHAQRITEAPRRLLAMIPGLKLVALEESDMCCGAAGSYSLSQPEMAERLGRRKARAIGASGAQELITANIGCTLQITRHLQAAGLDLPVRHVIEIFAEACG